MIDALEDEEIAEYFRKLLEVSEEDFALWQDRIIRLLRDKANNLKYELAQTHREMDSFGNHSQRTYLPEIVTGGVRKGNGLQIRDRFGGHQPLINSLPGMSGPDERDALVSLVEATGKFKGKLAALLAVLVDDLEYSQVKRAQEAPPLTPSDPELVELSFHFASNSNRWQKMSTLTKLHLLGLMITLLFNISFSDQTDENTNSGGARIPGSEPIAKVESFGDVSLQEVFFNITYGEMVDLAPIPITFSDGIIEIHNNLPKVPPVAEEGWSLPHLDIDYLVDLGAEESGFKLYQTQHTELFGIQIVTTSREEVEDFIVYRLLDGTHLVHVPDEYKGERLQVMYYLTPLPEGETSIITPNPFRSDIDWDGVAVDESLSSEQIVEDVLNRTYSVDYNGRLADITAASTPEGFLSAYLDTAYAQCSISAKALALMHTNAALFPEEVNLSIVDGIMNLESSVNSDSQTGILSTLEAHQLLAIDNELFDPTARNVRNLDQATEDFFELLRAEVGGDSGDLWQTYLNDFLKEEDPVSKEELLKGLASIAIALIIAGGVGYELNSNRVGRLVRRLIRNGIRKFRLARYRRSVKSLDGKLANETLGNKSANFLMWLCYGNQNDDRPNFGSENLLGPEWFYELNREKIQSFIDDNDAYKDDRRIDPRVLAHARKIAENLMQIDEMNTILQN